MDKREIIADVLDTQLPWMREALLELADKIIAALEKEKWTNHPLVKKEKL